MEPNNSDEIVYNNGTETEISDEDIQSKKYPSSTDLETKALYDEIDHMKYLSGKPKRIIITARIIHD
jgi:hypothetical protein